MESVTYIQTESVFRSRGSSWIYLATHRIRTCTGLKVHSCAELNARSCAGLNTRSCAGLNARSCAGLNMTS